jgi:hypothetical protein
VGWNRDSRYFLLLCLNATSTLEEFHVQDVPKNWEPELFCIVAGWVACTQSNSTCHGKISKKQWYNRSARGRLCNDAFAEQVALGNVKSTAEGLDICNLNSRTDMLCGVLKQSQTVIAQANCIYAGVCAPQIFVYTPGMYSSTNRDFVRTTVMDFYEMFRQVSGNPDDLSAFGFSNDTLDEDRVCPLDDFELELKFRNEAMKVSCASVQIDSLKKALRVVRIVVDKMVETVYIQSQILICIFRLLIPGSTAQDRQMIITEMEFYFEMLVNNILAAMEEIANIVFTLIFETGPFGQALQGMVDTLCSIVSMAMQAWNVTGCWIFREVVAPTLGFLVDIMEAIVKLIGQGYEVIVGFRKIVKYIDDMTCEGELLCSRAPKLIKNLEFGALPVATRCWADYTPDIDSTDAFSCTRSDTCRVSDMKYGTSLDASTNILLEDGNQIVCDQCPLQPGGVVNSFGCDVYTKQCTCNRPKLERTYCTSNQVCNFVLILFFLILFFLVETRTWSRQEPGLDKNLV